MHGYAIASPLSEVAEVKKDLSFFITWICIPKLKIFLCY